MNNQELRNTLIKELGLERLPPEAQEEIVFKLGEVILKSITVAIFEKLPEDARKEFEDITKKADQNLIQEFLEKHIPDLSSLMEQEVKRTLKNFSEGAK